MTKVVLVVSDEGTVMAPDDSPIVNLLSDMPKPPVGAKALALYARPSELVTKAKALVEMLDEREKYHGSLIGQETLSLVNELRLELAKWR